MDKPTDKNENNMQQARYIFEHRQLPSFFFEGKGEFMAALLDDNGILFRIMDDLCEQLGVENYYPAESFTVNPLKLTEDILALQLVFPNPEWVPNCFCAYCIFNMDFSLARYFTVEYDAGQPEGKAFICEWADGAHMNYGVHDVTGGKDLEKCYELLCGDSQE